MSKVEQLSFEVSPHDLKQMWSFGVMSDLSYIIFAIKSESDSDEQWSIDSFIHRWAIWKEELGEQELEDGWKPKTLKKRQVLNAISILEEKGLLAPKIEIEVGQLSLF